MVVTSRTRYWRTALLSCLVVGSVGFLVWAFGAGLGRATEVATVAGLLIAVAALVIAITQAWPAQQPPVDRVAAAAALAVDVRDQWIREVAARSVHTEGFILPVTWTIESAQFTDPDQPDHPWRRRKQGRLDGDFASASDEIAEEYRRVTNRRLVVLGEPGAGKTVMAILLTVGLLNRRFRDAESPPPSQEDPVPVLLAASSWDPVLESFDDWVVNAVALSHYNGDTRIPRMLLDSRLLLPVVDGLDEVPEPSRREAVDRINGAIGVSRPIVVTCRANEYERAIRGGAPVLLRSPVVRMKRMQAAETIRYLHHVIDDPDREGWQRIFEELRERSAGPLAEALSTPLMVSLLVAEYGRADSHPEELFDSAVHKTRHTVENHLFDNVVAARFADSPAGRYDPQQAARWLTFLARYLHQHQERDLAWWRMSERLMPRLAVPAVGIMFGLLLAMVVMTVTWWFPDVYTEDKQELLATSLAFGGLFAIMSTLTWYAVPARIPGRLVWAPVGAWPRVRRGLFVGFAIVMMPVMAALLAATAAQPVIHELKYAFVRNAVAIGVVAAAMGCVLGIGLAADARLSAPSERSSLPSPGAFLRHDRRSALAGAAAAAVSVMVAVVPMMLLGAALGDRLGHKVAPATRQPRPDGVLPFEVDLGLNGPVAVTFVVGFGLSIGALVLLTRAWPRFLLVRAYLAVRGRQPWRLPAFLAEARDRNLLRESGGMWQFHHIGLQHRLASRPPVESPSTQTRESPPLRDRRRRALLPAGTAVAVLIALAPVVLDRPLKPMHIPLAAPTEQGLRLNGSLPTDSIGWRRVVLSRDGTVLVRYREGLLDIWDIEPEKGTSTYRHVRVFPRAVALAVSGDNEKVALAGPFGVYEYFIAASGKGPREVSNGDASGLVYGGLAYVGEELAAIFGNVSEPGVPIRTLRIDETFERPMPDPLDGVPVLDPENPTEAEFEKIVERLGRHERLGPFAFKPGGTTKEFAALVKGGGGSSFRINIYSGSELSRILTGCRSDDLTAVSYKDDSSTLVTGSSKGTVRFPRSDDCEEEASDPLTSEKIVEVTGVAFPKIAAKSGEDPVLLVGEGEDDGGLPVVEVWR
ncbi:hypothetical protein [Micromonospora cathayae]|uniref:NACHT domain-containing protein n=1 Tax=Micromonospora cathayae TaxID=3028804 RepID=A0ABY7ZZH3_9ACTN|nr:hypothetical protein [Micromonospora sp. HUAS 3]WDZ87843.1 hypothetical protein PVK37_16255 [Micromonospora sp. HUAS 3]